MLITLVDTKTTESKFVLHKYPYEKISLQQLGLQKSSMSDIQTALADNFDEFGTYRKKSLVNTSSSPIPASAVLEIFIANEKNSQLVVGIDDDCVLVSRSAIMAQKPGIGACEGWNGENAELMDVTDECESIVNSVTLIWQLENFDGVEQAKHRLSFLLGVLQRKEQNSRFLTKEIRRVQAEREAIRKRTKDLVAINTKDSSQTYEDFRIKILTREIDANARRVREKISLFEMLREYYESWIGGKQFEVREEGGVWEGTIGRRVILQGEKKPIEQKTLVMLPPKLAQLLPSALYSDRVKHLYQKGFTFNHLSFRKLLERGGEVNGAQLYHTVHFLLRNNLAVDIYPINPPHSYNLFFLRNLPSRALIQKFNTRIFPGKNFLQVVLPYSSYKLAREEEETLKYLLLKELVGEVRIHVYRKCERQEEQGSDAMLQQLLSKYSLTEKDLNHLLSVQPFAFSKQSSLLNNIIRYIKDHHRQWGFFFLE